MWSPSSTHHPILPAPKTYLKGKVPQDAPNEKAHHGNPVQLHLPPLVVPALEDVAEGNAHVGGGTRQVRGADGVPAVLARHCGGGWMGWG